MLAKEQRIIAWRMACYARVVASVKLRAHSIEKRSVEKSAKEIL